MPNGENWIHLDLKGAIPPAADMCRWVDWIADVGYTGIVFEYEDRLEWESLPGTFHGGYTRDEWSRIWARCAERALEIVPLVQTIGHLEWLLRHSEYAALRECDLVDEICPSNPAARETIAAWIDEVIALHPGLRYLHLGGDEVWHMGSCGRCRATVESGADGLMTLFLAHMTPLIEQVKARGVTPMIWADMFWPAERQPLTARLPEGVVLVDWQYGWLGPQDVTAGLASGGHAVWAASAARSAYDMTHVLECLGQRVANIAIWQRQLAAGAVPGVIHTCWARSSSFRPLYGPLEAWLPVMLYAADPVAAAAHPLFQHIDQLDRAIYSDLMSDCQIAALRAELQACESELTHEFERRCLQWWDLAIEYAELRRSALRLPTLYLAQQATVARTQADSHVDTLWQTGRSRLLSQIIDWQARGLALWRSWDLSDGEEFFESRSGALQATISR